MITSFWDMMCGIPENEGNRFRRNVGIYMYEIVRHHIAADNHINIHSMETMKSQVICSHELSVFNNIRQLDSQITVKQRTDKFYNRFYEFSATERASLNKSRM